MLSLLQNPPHFTHLYPMPPVKHQTLRHHLLTIWIPPCSNSSSPGLLLSSPLQVKTRYNHITSPNPPSNFPPIKITSWNVKGLRPPIKRLKILCHFKRLKTDIALLQDNHLSSPQFHCMIKLWVGIVLGSSAIGCKAGVLIFIHKNLPCKVMSVDTDSHGHFLSLRKQRSSDIQHICPQ